MGRAEDEAPGRTLSAIVSGNMIAFFFCLPWALPIGTSRAQDWVLILYLGVFQIGLAYVFLASALRHVPALEASLLLLTEPVLNPLWAWWVHGETPGPWSFGGSAVIFAATVAKIWIDAAGGARASSSPPG